MTQPRLRPRFDVPLSEAPDRVISRLARLVSEKRDGVAGWARDGQAELFLEDDRHFFSPALHVLAKEEGGLRLQCRFAPLPQVWMVFVGLHFIVAMGGVAALMYGCSQLVVGTTPWALLGVPVAALGSAFVAGAAFIGQGLASEQMYRLRACVERVAGETGAQA